MLTVAPHHVGGSNTYVCNIEYREGDESWPAVKMTGTTSLWDVAGIVNVSDSRRIAICLMS